MLVFYQYSSFYYVLVVFLILMILLRHKKKPWKIYLFPFFELYLFTNNYAFILETFFMNYNDASDITKIMAGRDLIIYCLYFSIWFFYYNSPCLGIDLKDLALKMIKNI